MEVWGWKRKKGSGSVGSWLRSMGRGFGRGDEDGRE